jgi:hypothetical protein
MANAHTYEVGSVTGVDGVIARVGIDHDAVWVRASGVVLSRVQAETFAQLFVRACWLAGQQDAP